MCHGANCLDLRAILHLSQAVGSADAAAQNSGIRAIIACALALCAAGAKLHDAAGRMGVQASYTGRLGGDQAVEIHRLQQVGLDQDRTHQVALNADHLHMGVANRALGQSVHITLPLIGAQILAEFLAHTLGAQPADILLIEVIIQQEPGQLALACADGVTHVVRVLTEEHIEHKGGVLKAVQEQAVCHREFVEIHHHGRVIIIFVRNVRNNFDLVHEKFPLLVLRSSEKALPLLKKQPLLPLPLFQQCVGLHPVLTGRLYHDSIFAARVQGLL